MADQASSNIVINAPTEDVLAVIADIASYPQWTGQIKSAEVLETDADGRPQQARFVMDAGVLKDEYTLAYDWTESGVSWQLIGKSTVQKSQVGSYEVVATGSGTEVTYLLTLESKIPMIGPMKRKANKMIIDTALRELKKRVESLG